MCAAIHSAVSFDMFDVDGSGTLDEVRLRPRHALTHTPSLRATAHVLSPSQKEFVELCRVVNNASPLFPGNFATALELFDMCVSVAVGPASLARALLALTPPS